MGKMKDFDWEERKQTDSALSAFMREPGEQEEIATTGDVMSDQQVEEITSTPVVVELTDEEIEADVAEKMASIARNSKLVRLSMTQYKPTVRDKDVSKEIAKNKNATERAVTANVNLLPNLIQLEQLNNFCAEVRKEHNLRTVPYEDRGYRMVVSMPEMFKHWAWQKEKKKKLEELEKELFDVYDDYLDRIHLEMGDLYDPSNYLTKEEVLEKFTIEFDEKDVPNGELTVHLDEYATEEMADMVKEAKAKAHAAAMAKLDSVGTSVFDGLIDPLCNMIHQLRDENHDGTEHGWNDKTGEPKKPQYKSTLISNVLDQVNTIEQWFLKTLGEFDGPDNDAADSIVRLANNFRNVDTDILKEDDLLRTRTRDYALAMLRAVPRRAIDANRKAALKQQQKVTLKKKENGKTITFTKDAPAKNRIDIIDAI
tara:strand:+ start:1139 stop:2416 length:1278 start_codon:yes stop_codon:yes gene_type:complete